MAWRCFSRVELAGAVAPIARRSLDVLPQRDLVREVVVDDPFAPGELKPIPIHAPGAANRPRACASPGGVGSNVIQP